MAVFCEHVKKRLCEQRFLDTSSLSYNVSYFGWVASFDGDVYFETERLRTHIL
jgi:hypothetical protein